MKVEVTVEEVEANNNSTSSNVDVMVNNDMRSLIFQDMSGRSAAGVMARYRRPWPAHLGPPRARAEAHGQSAHRS